MLNLVILYANIVLNVILCLFDIKSPGVATKLTKLYYTLI